MDFESYGPFEFERTPIDRFWRKRFWSNIRNDRSYPANLERAVGCYAFCVSHGNTVRPWYVGKTLSQKGYCGEIFAKHKVDHYRNIMSGRNGTPSIMLFPLMTPNNWTLSRRKKTATGFIHWLEATLIGMAVYKNPELANVGNTRFPRGAYVNGIIGKQYPGQPSVGASYAKKAFLA